MADRDIEQVVDHYARWGLVILVTGSRRRTRDDLPEIRAALLAETRRAGVRPHVG